MIILGIDTSCDDTSVAVAEDTRILSSLVSSQAPIHRLFGGVVPELASRKHVELIDAVYGEALSQAGVALKDVDVLGVTQGPGLIGSVLVGLCFVKGLALATGKRLVGVNHVEAHAMSVFIEQEVEFPFIALIVSGGHTVLLYFEEPCRFRLIGTTRDDAAGEAFDKAAKYLSLGYPGGSIIEGLARGGRGDAVAFPRPMADERNYDFSYSGLKTAFINYIKNNGITDDNRCDILASFQEAAFDLLALKTLRACRDLGVSRLVVGGGVAANGRLREMLAQRCGAQGVSVFFPSAALCTDNAAMVAVTACFYARKGVFSDLGARAFSRMALRVEGC